jgi:hypothetical protein
MAHPEQQAFFGQLQRLYPQFFERVRVGEVGSLNINGSVRGFFSECDYTGFDVGPGPGVDQVVQGQLVGLPIGISTQC